MKIIVNTSRRSPLHNPAERRRRLSAYGREALMAQLILALAAVPAMAYDQGLINMITPGNLETGQLEVTIQHRFLGAIADHPGNTLLGIDAGANPSLSIRAPVWRTLGIDGGYTRDHKEFWAGASWRWRSAKSFLDGALGVELYSDKQYGDAVRAQNGYYWLALQANAVAGFLYPAVDGSYDAYSGRAGAGIGASAACTGWLSLLAEYFPELGAAGAPPGTSGRGVFGGGVKISTAGHHFVLLLSNSTGIGARQALPGAPSSRLHLGFIIQRRIEFN